MYPRRNLNFENFICDNEEKTRMVEQTYAFAKNKRSLLLICCKKNEHIEHMICSVVDEMEEVEYFNVQDWIDQFVQAIKSRRHLEFEALMTEKNCLIFSEIEVLVNRPSMSRSFAEIIVNRYKSNKKTLLFSTLEGKTLMRDFSDLYKYVSVYGKVVEEGFK